MRKQPLCIRAPAYFPRGCTYLTASKLYRVAAASGALLEIIDDEGDVIAINPKDCKHTGGVWEQYREDDIW